jgi:hypothetical protein
VKRILCRFVAVRLRSSSAALCIHAAVIGGGMSLARSVLAQEASPSASEAAGEQARAQARVLFKEGLGLLDGAHYAEALERFERAYTLWRNPKILLNLATTRRALGQNASAATAYVRYLETAEPDNARRAEVEDVLRELSARVGRVVCINVEGIERLSLDGVELPGVAGGEFWVEPGNHTLTAERMGHTRESRRLEVAPGEARRVDWSESPRPTALNAARAAVQSDARKAPARRSFTQRSALRILARADFDATTGGAAGAGGIAFEPLDLLRVTGGAVISAHQGAWVGLECSPFHGPVRPVLGTSAPIFFAGRVYAGLSGELGVRFLASARLVPVVRIAIAHFPSVPSGYVSTLFVPSAGLEVGL